MSFEKDGFQERTPEEENAKLREALIAQEIRISELHAKVLERDQRIATLQEIINTDRLTQLRSRGALENKILSIDERRRENQESGSETESKKNVAVLILDIDNFKQINDTYGHLVGDHVLVEVGKFLKDEFRKDDFVGRWGGEEFMVLLRATNLELLMKKFYDPQAKRARLGFVVETDGKTIPITFSGGLAMLESGEDIQDAVSRADDALYTAKRGSVDGDGEKTSARDRILSYTNGTAKAPQKEEVPPETIV